jgi:hypothetical protein
MPVKPRSTQPCEMARWPLALTVSSRRAYDDSSKYLYKLWLPSVRDESFRFVAHHLIAPPWSFSMVASRLRLSLTVLSLAGVLAASQQTLAAPAPAVTTTLPQAVAPGSQTDVKVRGSGLTGTTLLWTSFAGTAALTPDVKDNGKNAAEVTWRLNLPADVPVGIHGLRTAGPSGSSALKLIMVDDLPSVAQAAGNTVIDKAQEIAPLAAVDGAVANLSRNYYRVKVAAGQKLSIEVVARRLGSALDPLLRILDANGRELTYSDDEPFEATPDCSTPSRRRATTSSRFATFATRVAPDISTVCESATFHACRVLTRWA